MWAYLFLSIHPSIYSSIPPSSFTFERCKLFVGGVRLGGWGVVLVVCVCVGVGGVVLSLSLCLCVCVCVCV